MVAGESSYQSSCESDGDGQSSVASPSYKVCTFFVFEITQLLYTPCRLLIHVPFKFIVDIFLL